jgi:oxygen-dependent protoporphyrinogen oxidase
MSIMIQSDDVIVVGGGIAGLAAAHRLHSRHPELRIRLIEAGASIGGKISTQQIDGFVIEDGPDCFLAVKQAGVELCRELGLEDTLRGTDPANRRSFIKRAGALNQLPAGLTGLVPSRVGPLLTTKTLSVTGRLRCGLEYFVPPRRDGGDESIADFTTRRFGREAYDWLVEPLMAGIHAGDGEQLSLAATFPQLREMEAKGSLLRQMLTRRRASQRSPSGAAFLTPEHGLRQIVDALLDRLDGIEIQTATPAAEIMKSGDQYRVRLQEGAELATRALVLATPAFATADLVRTLSPSLARVLSEIPFVSTAIVTLAYHAKDVARPLDGSGYVSPRAEGGPVVACSWTSSKFMHRAPSGTVLIRLFIGRAGDDRIVAESTDSMITTAREEVGNTMGIHADPILSRVARWDNALPQYTIGHLARVEQISKDVAGFPGLALAGASYNGVGIPDCIQSGWDAAAKIGRIVRQ